MLPERREPASVDAAPLTLRGFVQGLQRRARLEVAAQAIGLGAAALAASGVVARLSGVGPPARLTSLTLLAGLLVSAAWMRARRRTWSSASVVARAEAAEPGFRNHLVTAVEIARYPDRASARVAALVEARALAVARAWPAGRLFPVGRSLVLLAAGVLTALAGLVVARTADWRTVARPGDWVRVATGTATSTGIGRVDARVISPAYAERAVVVLRDPARLEVMAGGRIELRVETGAPTVEVSLDEVRQTVRRDGTAAVVTLGPERPGVVVLTAKDATGSVSARRVLAVTVTPDDPPRIVFDTPGTDLLLPDAGSRVRFAARAVDDLALGSLTLHYTRVSGSGEQFAFTEGELSWALAKGARADWRAQAEHGLGEIGLQEGDLLVYFARATDLKPGREPVVSDAFVIEIGKPQAAIAGGFAIPPDEERHAISLSALIQKTERLHARRARLAAPAFADEVAGLAVEQRMVRTETLFLMGSHGHVEDEEEEAAHAHEIQEGRLENRGQAELLLAVRRMTVAEQRLIASDTGAALVAQREALAALQRGLSRQRYFLRTVPARSQIDLTRRASGDLSSARSWPLPIEPPDRSRVQRVLALLAEAGALAGAGDGAASTAPVIAAFAARVLALDPASPVLQQAATTLTRAAAQPPGAPARIEALRAAVRALDQVAGAVPSTSSAPAWGSAGGLAGAFVDALRAPSASSRP